MEIKAIKALCKVASSKQEVKGREEERKKYGNELKLIFRRKVRLRSFDGNK